ncbi:amidohydrolase [Mycobacteroides abscessus subsp. abscessus]|nr:amidohydrolase [Mycobacteroides abscessus subsp. abscessus]
MPTAGDAAALARDLNNYTAELVSGQPDRFGFFATVPMPHIDYAVAETTRALDDLNADGVVLLANNAGTYLGEEGQDDLFAALDARSAPIAADTSHRKPGGNARHSPTHRNQLANPPRLGRRHRR